MKKLTNFLYTPKIGEFFMFAILLLLLAIVAFSSISYNDFWWHLALGKWMSITKSLLSHDIFSYTYENAFWINQTWLFDKAIYSLYQGGGIIGINVFRFLLFIATYFLFLKAGVLKQKSTVVLAVGLLIFTLPMLRNLIRPEIMSPLFIGFFLYALYSHQQHTTKILYLLPFVQILWANIHGSFYIGPILIGIFFLATLLRTSAKQGSQIKILLRDSTITTYLWLGITTTLATLVNPYGYGVYELFFKVFNDPEILSTVSEWLPVSSVTLFNLQPTHLLSFVILFWLGAAALMYRVITHYRSTKSIAQFFESLPYEDIFIYVLFAYSAFRYNRGMYVFMLICALVILRNYEPKTNSYAMRLLQYCCVAGALTFFLFIPVYKKINIGPSDLEHPVYAAQFIKDHHIAGPMLNEYAQGSDLIWLLYPEHKVFIDGRAITLYPNDFYWHYRNNTNDKIFAGLEKKYNFNFIIFPNNATFTKKLALLPEWQLVFFDNAASVYVKKNETNQSLIASNSYVSLNPASDFDSYKSVCENSDKKNLLIKEIERQLTEVPTSLYSTIVLANLSIWCPDKYIENRLPALERLLTNGLLLQPTNPDLYNVLGSVQLNRNAPLRAYQTFKKSAKMQPTKAALTGLGTALFNLDRYKEAAKIFEQIPAASGNEPKEYYQMYGRTLYHLDKNERAITLMLRYLELAETEEITAADYLYLSRSYNDAGFPTEAEEYFQKSLELDTADN